MCNLDNMLRGLLFLIIASLMSSVQIEDAKAQNNVISKSVSASGSPLSWPREYTNRKGDQLVLYQPQIDEWADYQILKGKMAAAYTIRGSKNQEFGVVSFSARTQTDLDTREVVISEISIEQIDFPDLDRKALANVASQIGSMLPTRTITISVDRVTAALERTEATKNNQGLNEKAPPIFVTQAPAILVIFDGNPIWAPIKATKLQYAVNTNWDVFYLKRANTYWLRNEDMWFQTTNLSGQWSAVNSLPAEFNNLPKDKNWEATKAQIPSKNLKGRTLPIVAVSFKPAELIIFNGTPKYKSVPGTSLIYAANSDSTLLYDNISKQYYYLVSGRWFSSKFLKGPWSFASNKLPADFEKIPANGDLADILSSVPGTEAAKEAIILASIPQKARVSRKGVKFAVSYDGDPKFIPIKGTKLRYAVNTKQTVILATDGKYYAVHKGVWFVASSPKGPWGIADKIPNEIYGIPASSPVHNVTYVRIYETHPDYVVYGYTSGYLGAMVAYGALVYGTGWWYPPYYHWGNYPIYRAYPMSYGAKAYYNPATGTFGRAGFAYGPYRGIGAVAGYNPVTGRYVRGAAAYGPGGARGWIGAYNPRTGVGAVHRGGSNLYGSWGTTNVRRGTDWVRSASVRNNNGAAAGWKTSRGNQGFVAKGRGTDLYAGRNGNVFKRDQNGNWSKVGRNRIQPGVRPNLTKQPGLRAGKTSVPYRPKTSPVARNSRKVQKPARRPMRTAPRVNRYRPPQNVSRAYRSREIGRQRVQRYNNYQRTARSRSSSGFNRGANRSYRGGGFRGGQSRGGGGRRGGLRRR